MRRRRLWLALVVALFCLPLFYGLDRTDLDGDEAIYSFAVDRILADGEWLTPKNIPLVDEPFLEKPPLKFWIVAAPIRAGLLPQNEFGFRFWDAAFGSAAFVYVFLIGVQLLNPLAGAVAVLILFAHHPLLFIHGLRSNTMEAPLVLAYCGAVYHFIAWGRSRRPLHAAAVALYFALGFMTKFVAALFLPIILAAAIGLSARHRQAAVREWRTALGAVTLAAALIAPWFVWAHVTFGAELWRWMFGVHVYQRFAGTLHPEHLQPWPFYWTTLAARLSEGGALPLALVALPLLAARAVRNRWPEGLLVVLWFAVPMAAMTLGTSKLYHYLYPFLPPVALAAGYLTALLFAVGPAPFARGLDRFYAGLNRRMPRLTATFGAAPVRWFLIILAAISLAAAVASLVVGTIRIDIEPYIHFRSRGTLRPALVAFLCLLAAGIPRHAAPAVLTILIVGLLPLAGYRDSIARLGLVDRVEHDASACLADVQHSLPDVSRGLFVAVPQNLTGHSLHYYFRRAGDWVVADSSDLAGLHHYLTDPGALRPALVWDDRFVEYAAARPGSQPAAFIRLTPDVLLLLPGPYARCADGRPAGAR